MDVKASYYATKSQFEEAQKRKPEEPPVEEYRAAIPIEALPIEPQWVREDQMSTTMIDLD